MVGRAGDVGSWRDAVSENWHLGAVRPTPKVLHFDGCKPLVVTPFHEASVVQAPSIPADVIRHLDEVFCWIGGKQMYLWRAFDDEGEVLDVVVQRRRDTGAAPGQT